MSEGRKVSRETLVNGSMWQGRLAICLPVGGQRAAAQWDYSSVTTSCGPANNESPPSCVSMGMSRTGVVQSKVLSPPFQCLSPPSGSIHHSVPQWGVGNGSTFLRSANQSDSRYLSLGTFMACHKAGLWGITAPSNPAK